MSRKITLILLAFISGVLGFMTCEIFTNFSISFLNLGEITLTSTSLRESFIECLIFSFSLAAVPLILLLKDMILGESLFSLRKDIISIGLIVALGGLIWRFRIFQINQTLSTFLNKKLSNTFPFSSLNFSLYLMIGFLLGGVISIILSRKSSLR